nr:unnamed protein product [Spirometra erinaceieuropaei]
MYFSVWTGKVTAPASGVSDRRVRHCGLFVSTIIEELKGASLLSNEVKVPFDVMSLCSSVPLDLRTGMIKPLLESEYDGKKNRLEHAQVPLLLKSCLKAYYTFDETPYIEAKQTPAVTDKATTSEKSQDCSECEWPNEQQQFGGMTPALRQQRGDLILVYKIIHGLEYGLKFEDMFQWHLSPNLRGHPMKLRTTMSRLNLRSEFFTQRVVEKWNDLPQSVVEATSLQLFKKRLDDYLCPLFSLDGLNLN